MRALRTLAFGLLPALPFLAAGACSDAPARIALMMQTPQGLLDDATAVELSVFDASLAPCDPSGHAEPPVGEETKRFSLSRTGCAEGVAWCREIVLEQDGAEKVFAVVARSAAGVLGEGCVVAAVDQDPLEVAIQIQRYNPPACCNDGVLQAGEQCDLGEAAPTTCAGAPGGVCLGIIPDEVCECDCLAREILLSAQNSSTPPLGNGPPRSKGQLAMTFAPGNEKNPVALRTVYQNTDASAVGGADLSVRLLGAALYPILDPFPLSQQLRLPLACDNLSGSGIPRTQQEPSIAAVSTDSTVIAYASDEKVGGKFDVMLAAFTEDGCAEVPPLQISANANAPGSRDPDVAGGPTSTALTVWTRDNRVFGRIWRPGGQLLPESGEIEITQSGTAARVAGGPQGWVVVYQGAGSGDGDGIFLKSVDATGVVGAERRVNAITEGVQDQPDVAQLGDGRVMVVWRHQGDIYFQRFSPDGAVVIGDQEDSLNSNRAGEQRSPAIAGSSDFFAAAWEDLDTGGVSARLAGGSGGFRFNSVTGQNDAFSAGHPAVPGSRTRPAVAIGGGFVVIGWQDDSDVHPGVYVRRFPLPQ